MNDVPLQPPPTIFKFTGPVPPQVQVHSDGKEVRITVSPPMGKQRWPLIRQFGIVVVLAWCMAVTFAIVLPPHLLHFKLTFLVAAVLFTLGPLAAMGAMLGRPTIFSIRDNSMFRLLTPNNSRELCWPLYEPEMLWLNRYAIIYGVPSSRRVLRMLQGFPPETREWVVREFKAAGEWARAWLDYKVHTQETRAQSAATA
jgi:hypothetical protein